MPQTEMTTEDAPPPSTSADAGGGVSAWLPWALPFVAYIAVLSSDSVLPLDPTGNHILRLVLVGLILAFYSLPRIFGRHAGGPGVDWKPRSPLLSVLLGVVVFVIWVAPDALVPGYRSHWLFSNSLFGDLSTAGVQSAQGSTLFLVLRVLVSVLMVPVLEELFWRGFLLRIFIRNHFEAVPLGTYHRDAFWFVAVLFALEHGVFWEVGLVAGVLYNYWMIRTKSLADVILAHAVTNGALAAYVLILARWEFWP